MRLRNIIPDHGHWYAFLAEELEKRDTVVMVFLQERDGVRSIMSREDAEQFGPAEWEDEKPVNLTAHIHKAFGSKSPIRGGYLQPVLYLEQGRVTGMGWRAGDEKALSQIRGT